MKNFNEFKINESSVDYDLLHKITNLPCYNKLKEDFRKSTEEFIKCVSSEDIGYDDGDSDHDMSLMAAIQDALDEVKY